MNQVLVIIVTYNGLKWMKKCLDSIRQSSIPLDTIIIDNGSTDGTQDFIKKEYPEMKFVQLEYLQLISSQYFISNKSGIWSLSLIVHSKG